MFQKKQVIYSESLGACVVDNLSLIHIYITQQTFSKTDIVDCYSSKGV